MSWAALEHMGVPKRKKRKGPARPLQEPLTLPCFLPWEGGARRPPSAPGLHPWEVGLEMLAHLFQVPLRTRACGDRPFLSDLGPKENGSWQVGGVGRPTLHPQPQIPGKPSKEVTPTPGDPGGHHWAAFPCQRLTFFFYKLKSQEAKDEGSMGSGAEPGSRRGTHCRQCPAESSPL